VDAVPGLWCAPATIDLAGAEIELVPRVARETRLAKALRRLLTEGTGLPRELGAQRRAGRDGAPAPGRPATPLAAPRPDYVLIDCPPSLGLLTINALAAAREVLIPIQCEYYALEGLTQLLRNIELVRSQLNPDIAVTAILLTMYDGRTRLAAGVADEVRAHFPQLVLRTVVPRSVRISEAPSYGQTVITFDPGSPGALSYLEAARELAERGAPSAAGAPQATDGAFPTAGPARSSHRQPAPEVRP
jgi:chromosome partitioning protein